METRLNKLISEAGVCSRREADRMIESGRVTVNGKKPDIGQKIKSSDIIRIDGRVIEHQEERVYIALNKPAGITCTTDPTESGNIIDFVNYPTRIFNIGRLDKPSEGLILLTNDGDIVNKILRAANNHEKEYEVQVDKPVNEEFIRKMSQGIPILGTVTKKCKVTKESEYGFRIILTQGLNRQIRRMCEYLGYNVTRLKRVRIMNITIDKLELGHWRVLTEAEMESLNHLLKDSTSHHELPVKEKTEKTAIKKKPAPYDADYEMMLAQMERFSKPSHKESAPVPPKGGGRSSTSGKSGNKGGRDTARNFSKGSSRPTGHAGRNTRKKK